MIFCNCALPSIRGNDECCKNCINNKIVISNEFLTSNDIEKIFEKININKKYNKLIEILNKK